MAAPLGLTRFGGRHRVTPAGTPTVSRPPRGDVPPVTARPSPTKFRMLNPMKRRDTPWISRKSPRLRGYTLTELLIVLAIVTVLAFLLVPRFLG